jgi:hypothetical protein
MHSWFFVLGGLCVRIAVFVTGLAIMIRLGRGYYGSRGRSGT